MSVINVFLLHYNTDLFYLTTSLRIVEYDSIMIKKYFLESENVKDRNSYRFDKVRVPKAVTFSFCDINNVNVILFDINQKHRAILK